MVTKHFLVRSVTLYINYRLSTLQFLIYVLRHEIKFQQFGILTWIDSGEHVQPPFKIRNSKCCLCAGWSEPLLVAQTALLEISCSGSCMDLLIVLLRNAPTSYNWCVIPQQSQENIVLASSVRVSVHSIRLYVRPQFLSVSNHISVPIVQIQFILSINDKYHRLSIFYKFFQTRPLTLDLLPLSSYREFYWKTFLRFFV